MRGRYSAKRKIVRPRATYAWTRSDVAACVFAPDALPVGGGRYRIVLDAARKRGRVLLELASAGAAFLRPANSSGDIEAGAGAMAEVKAQIW